MVSSYNMVPVGLVLKMVIGGTDKFLKAKDDFTEIKKTEIKKFKLNDEQSKHLSFSEKLMINLTYLFYKVLLDQKNSCLFRENKGIIKKNNQALVLLPEIFLTNDFKVRFEDFFVLNLQYGTQNNPKQKNNLERNNK